MLNPITLSLAIGAAAAASGAVPQTAPALSVLANAGSNLGTVIDVAGTATFADGTYTGPSVDAYWGQLQIQATVQNGKIASLKVLRYPSDRRESVAINQQALPRLRDEVVAAQSTKVNIVSGATLTSQAFMRSLDGALNTAKGTSL